MNYADIVRQESRLVLLRVLAEVPGYEANSSILQSALESFGLQLSRDVIHTELAWLTEQGLVITKAIATVVIATLTSRGLDVAGGKATVPGVKKPSPRG